MIQKINPITAHELTLMPPTAHQADPFGWVRLLNGGSDVGYVYLDPHLTPQDPHLSHDGSYIVTALPLAMLGQLLEVLRSEAHLQIRFFDPQTAGVSPSVFIEPSTAGQQPTADAILAPREVAEHIARLLRGRERR